jgi:thiamine pyrophosphate-dependent acetolactate synthase large subunit-like protein
MTVIFDNGVYYATKRPLAASYPDGTSVREDRWVGVDLTPSMRYDLVAQSVGAHGERVDDPADVLPALRRGLARVRAGQSVVLDVVLARP